MDTQGAVMAEDVQVAAKPRRRTYTAEYKRRILKEADACTTPGVVGALLRREGLYSSHLVVWRRARGRGELAALAPRKRGRKPTPIDARDRKITELERQLAAMTGRAERAEALVDAQKNLAGRRAAGAGGPATAAGAPADPDGGRSRRGLGPAARGAVRRSAAGPGLGSGARRRPGAAVFDPHDVPGAGGERRGARTPQPAPAPGVPQARAARDRPQPGLELGHHQAPGPRHVDLLLPLRVARYLQPLRRRLAPGSAGVRGLGQGADRRELRAPAHRSRAAHHSCRPRPLDDFPARGPAAGDPGRGPLALPAPRLQ